jgi:8-oxo-dGTP pyrophosphatase MutT (NUDIX family)
MVYWILLEAIQDDHQTAGRMGVFAENDEKPDNWEIFPDRVLLQTPIVTIKAGPVLCRRSGRCKDFYIFDFPDWVNVVAVTPDDQIVLIRQFRYGSGKAEIEIPGGMVDQGEDPVAAGCRELLEETGYAGIDARIIGKVCPNPAIQRNHCYTVLVEQACKVAEPRMEDMEDIETSPVTVEAVREYMASGQIGHGLVLNALMFYLSF